MWNIEHKTEWYNTHNGNLSSFNRIKRSSLMRSNDAVETVEGHTEDEQNTA